MWLGDKVGQLIPLTIADFAFPPPLPSSPLQVQKGPEEEVQLEVYLANGKRVMVDIVSTDQTEEVLETVREERGWASGTPPSSHRQPPPPRSAPCWSWTPS